MSSRWVGLREMTDGAAAYLLPPACAQGLINHAVLGKGLAGSWLDVAGLLLGNCLSLAPFIGLHLHSRRLGC